MTDCLLCSPRTCCVLATLTLLCSSLPVWAQEEEPSETIRDIEIIQTPEDIAKTGGSTQVIDEKTLEAQEHDDVHSILLQVPGVYIRQEDGFGLRPNIGIRGANSERSKKVTLMEDGVLFGPAPYSAPAAYYFPIMTRMVGLEVFKGPSSILFGPQTIGGALNVVTRPVPVGNAGGLDVSVGLFPSAKLHVWQGYGWSQAGVLIEGVQLWSNGFKELDGGGDTGFDRSEVMLKAYATNDPTSKVFQRVSMKATYSRERSNETYLGLSDEDFEASPDRRYASSALDKMDWWRLGLRLDHELEVASLKIKTSLYRHDFQRSWKKFTAFADGTDAAAVLAQPTGTNGVFYDVLRGRDDSSSVLGNDLILGTNARDFVSQGVQTVLKHTHTSKRWQNKVEAGIRLHQDGIVRDHTEETYAMRDGVLVRTQDPTRQATNNDDSTLALAAWVVDQFAFWRMTITPGLRVEHVRTSRQDLVRPNDATQENVQTTLIPGVGATIRLGAGFSALAGAYRGYSPVAPGQGEEVTPESSINYEMGVRFKHDPEGASFVLSAETIGFVSDYRNLVGQCTFSAGCQEQDLDDQFNAGQAFIYGAEALFGAGWRASARSTLSVAGNYTFTQTEFTGSFTSNNPQYAKVEVGDQMPYVPTHQAALNLTWASDTWGGNLSGIFVGRMLEQAGQPDAVPATDTNALLNALISYQINPGSKAYLKAENIFNSRPVASRRPYGARSIQPRLVQLGYKLNWGSAVEVAPASMDDMEALEDEMLLEDMDEDME